MYILPVVLSFCSHALTFFSGVGKNTFKRMLQYYYDVNNRLSTYLIQLIKYVFKFYENCIISLFTIVRNKWEEKGHDQKSTLRCATVVRCSL